MNLKNDPLIQEYIQNHNLKPNTIIKFTRGITLYSQYLNKTPEQWITEAENEEEALIRMRRRKIKIYLLNFKDYLDSQNFSVLSIKTHMGSIRAMYRENDIEVPKIILKKDTRQELRDSIPTKEDIRYALTLANLKYRAIILLMSSSGMGMSEIISLTYQNFLDAISEYVEMSLNAPVDVGELTSILQGNNQLIIGTWNIQRIKTEMAYVTFSSPESIEAILKYLKSDPPQKLDDPLFRTGIKPTRHETFCVYFQRLNKRCGFGKPDRQAYFRSHNLRKYFATTISEHISKLKVDRLLGHAVDSQTNSYFKTNLPELKEAYINTIPFISIRDTEIHDLKSPEFKQLEAKFESNKRDMDIMKKQIMILERDKKIVPPK
jgi:integrase